MGAYRFERHAGRRTVGLAAIGCFMWVLAASASAQASTVPVIESESVSNVTATDATLEASVNPKEAATGDYYQFQLVRSPSEYASEILCPAKLPAGTDGCIGTQSASALPIGFIPGNTAQPGVDHPISLDLASAGVTLQPGTTYHYRVLVARRVQTEDTIEWEPPTVYGADQTFTTPSGPPPSIEGESLSHLTSTDATLEAQINTEGLSTLYQFQLAYTRCRECMSPTYNIPLPSGLLLGSFLDQTVSLDLNSAGVILKPGFYEYSLSATSTGGTTAVHGGSFEPPEEVVQPLNTTTPSRTNGNNQGTSSTPAGSGGSPAPGVTPVAPQIMCLCDCARGCHGKNVSPKHLTRTQKRSKALKACAKKPKRKRAACRKQAREKYATTGKRAK
jgi:hypothetical protein